MTQKYISIKDEVLTKLERALPILQEKYGIATIGIFGSVSRREDTRESDVDALYSFEEERGDLHDYLGLLAYLEKLFGREVELVAIAFIDPYLKSAIKNDAVLYGAHEAIV